MQLRKLEILGFKSFADKTKLEFHNGITAVVGPNGCGKSNIADAFRWVLGEQSAKSMRGHKMPDVIFAGTSHRKPLNFAEVTITLDEVNGSLPIDYEEISITRRLHRSGESEYFINRQPVRLKDIQSLFLDSGMGKDAYSIFEQGKIDQVINLSPLERRYIFEEAAGILRFLQRKKEALRKLELTDANVSRVKDIHQEVEKQILFLEKQAEKARQYRLEKQELEKLEKTSLVVKWDGTQQLLLDARNKSTNYESRILEINSHLTEMQKELFAVKQAWEGAAKSLRSRSEEVYQIRSSKEVRSKERLNFHDRLKELLAKEKHCTLELESLIEKCFHRQKERAILKKSQEALILQLKSKETELKAQKEQKIELEAELAKQRHSQQIKQQDCLRSLQAESQRESELKQMHIRLENTRERLKKLLERQDFLTTSAKELTLQLDEKKQQLEQSSASIDGQREFLSALENNLQDLVEKEINSQRVLHDVQLEAADAKARQKALQRLRDDMEGFSKHGKQLLQESAKPSSPLFKKIKGLYEYFTPKKGVESALAALMQSYEDTLVVETEEDFNQVLSYVNQHKLKDFSILCLESAAKAPSSPPKMPVSAGVSPFSIDVVENTLTKHFLKNTYMVHELEVGLKVAIEGSGLEILTRNGLFIDRHAVFFYSPEGTNNVFLREAELKALDQRLSDKEQEKHHCENVLKSIQQKKSLIQAERIELDKAIRRGDMKLVEINFSLQKFHAELEKNCNEEKVVAAEVHTLVKLLEEYSATAAELNTKYLQARTAASDVRKLAESINEQLELQASLFKHHTHLLQEHETTFQRIVEENQKQLHALHVLDIKDMENAQQQIRLEEEVEVGRQLQMQFQDKEAQVAHLLDQVEQNLSEAVSKCSLLEQETASKKSAIEHYEAAISENSRSLKKFESDRNQISIQIAQLESICQSLQNELDQRHHMTMEEVRCQCGIPSPPLSADQMEIRIRMLRQQLEHAGSEINMTSIEECDKAKDRYQFLNQQIDDLHLSKQQLVTIIAELDKESRHVFKATFDKICHNFKKNFQILFNGGEADLQFTETSDVLEAGIEIIAKPPGKQMRSISLLSGGEKCLTAMALLFAIFEVRPAPFCILDEIDAPLDDTNVDRFVNIVKEFADRCQFIIITHNKRTMAISDVIFGVSMEEKGISKLLSMDFLKNSSDDSVHVIEVKS